MPTETSAKVSDSLNGDSSQTPEGETGKTVEQLLEEAKSENKRKSGELAEVRRQLTEFKTAAEARIAELEAKGSLTPSQQKEHDSLESAVDSLEKNPDAQVWIKLMEKISRKVSQETTHEFTHEEDYQRALLLTSALAEQEKMEGEKFETELFQILDGGRWSDKNPTTRVQLAYKEWKRIKGLEAKASGKEGEPPKLIEGSGRRTTSPTTKDEIKSSIDSGNFKNVLKKVAETLRP